MANKHWLSGVVFPTYGLVSSTLSSEAAILTISGKISPLTCSMAMVNGQPQRHCGRLTYNVDIRRRVSSPAKGVTTEVIAADGDSKRRIVLSHYD